LFAFVKHPCYLDFASADEEPRTLDGKRFYRSEGSLPLHGTRVFVALLCLGGAAPPAGAADDSGERRLFQLATETLATPETVSRASNAAHVAAEKRDLDVLDQLIALRSSRLLSAFASGWRGPSSPGLEEMVLDHFDDPDIAVALIPMLHEFRGPGLFEALYRDVTDLAAWRARRRRDCHAVIWSVPGLTRPGSPASVRSPYAPPLPHISPQKPPSPPPAAVAPPHAQELS